MWLAAAALLLAIGFSLWRTRHVVARGDTYVLLLYEDSSYRRPGPGEGAHRLAEMERWGDSLSRRGELQVAGHLVGTGMPGGLFLIRARSDSDAARIAASSPFIKWGGRIDVWRFIE